MKNGLLLIESRKHALVAECEAQRELLADAWLGLCRPVDVCGRAVNKLRSPWLWAGVGLVALKLPKRNLLRIPVLLWKGYQMLRKVRAMTR